MAVVGSLQIFATGFDTQDAPPTELVQRLQRLCASCQIRLLDALLVVRDDRGVLSANEDSVGLEVTSTPPGATLRQLFDGPDVEVAPTTVLELRSSAEVGLDLTAVESFADRIAPGTSALLLLVEQEWATELLDVVLASGGFPLVFGCLEPETMLIIGPQVAEAARVAEARDLAAAAKGSATLDAMASGPAASSTLAAAIIQALLVAGVIRGVDINRVVSSLERAQLIPPPGDRAGPSDRRSQEAWDPPARSGEGTVTPLARIRPNTLSSLAGSSVSDGDLSLEVRWIIPGVLVPEMIEWFGPSPARIETRRDYYLVNRTGPQVGVKVRGDSQLDVKLYGGSPGVLTLPGRAQGRLGWWRRWSFPLRAAAEATEPAGWASVQKVRRIRFVSRDRRTILNESDATVAGGCTVELTQVTVDRRRWWTLGFEAAGPSDALTSELHASAALMFDHPLPTAMTLGIVHSTSYPEWVATNWKGGPH
jgi:uncharacterized membrane protein